MHLPTTPWICAWLTAGLCGPALAAPACTAQSGDSRTPVIELYTSEGCSSCPPADQWLSTLKGKPVVAQAFHVGYWDYIGWTDRFASPAFTARQYAVASQQGARTVYTPQVVRDARDWRDWRASRGPASESGGPARARITLTRLGDTDQYEARVTPAAGVGQWSAYWTVTEHGHASKVKAGENSGAYLQHDFVVRQLQTAPTFTGAQTLTLSAGPARPEHPRQINLVVTDPKTLTPLQALSLQCFAQAS